MFIKYLKWQHVLVLNIILWDILHSFENARIEKFLMNMQAEWNTYRGEKKRIVRNKVMVLQVSLKNNQFIWGIHKSQPGIFIQRPN
jgi:hypothetical protein